MDEEIPTSQEYKKELFKTIYISLRASSKCNMNCKYCFMQDKPNVNITTDEAKCFIDFYFPIFRNRNYPSINQTDQLNRY